jgi:hypothetical protein
MIIAVILSATSFNRNEKQKKQFNIINQAESEETMNSIRKCLVILGMGVTGWFGILLMVKAVRSKRHTGMYEKVGKGIDERLSESKAALNKATAHVQSIFEQIKNRKP